MDLGQIGLNALWGQIASGALQIYGYPLLFVIGAVLLVAGALSIVFKNKMAIVACGSGCILIAMSGVVKI